MSVHVKIRNIGPGQQNLLLKGVIVRSLGPRKILLRKGDRERGVWTFTLRDSVCDFINISVWGSFEFVQKLSDNFLINDIVDVMNGNAVFRQIKDSDESAYHPRSSCSFNVTINETQGSVEKVTVNVPQLTQLIGIPAKLIEQYFTVSDVLSTSQNVRGTFVDVFAAVRNMESKSKFVSRNGYNVERRDIFLTDQSYKVVRLTIWDADLLKMSETWIERNTVLYLADVRIDWDEYRQSMSLSTVRRTIITVDPDSAKARDLKKFILSVPYQATTKLDQILHKYSEPATITTIMSCDAVIAKCKEPKQSTEFTALVYCLLESFQIDNGEERIVVIKCKNCLWKVEPVCLNGNCPSAKGYVPFEAQQVYDIKVTFIDHTNGLSNCRLTNEVAAQLIGFNASQFQELNDDAKTEIKWRFLMKYFTARLIVVPMKGKEMPLVTVVAMEPLSFSKYSSLIPIM